MIKMSSAFIFYQFFSEFDFKGYMKVLHEKKRSDVFTFSAWFQTWS